MAEQDSSSISRASSLNFANNSMSSPLASLICFRNASFLMKSSTIFPLYSLISVEILGASTFSGLASPSFGAFLASSVAAAALASSSAFYALSASFCARYRSFNIASWISFSLRAMPSMSFLACGIEPSVINMILRIFSHSS